MLYVLLIKIGNVFKKIYNKIDLCITALKIILCLFLNLYISQTFVTIVSKLWNHDNYTAIKQTNRSVP